MRPLQLGLVLGMYEDVQTGTAPSWASGWWECVATTSAVAEATSEITIGTWVLSALHRNPALTVKAVSTLDEIAGGRLLFGFGAGHSAKQGAAFGYPPDKVVGRYEEALQIVVPLLRDGKAEFEGHYHRAALTNRPTGPRPGSGTSDWR
jgi:alkanesulfonate monooxygenase SsuD/methylene tetrahydromethanopterin reductase-like flavin-dependent oxidoreductase (luciferase family)